MSREDSSLLIQKTSEVLKENRDPAFGQFTADQIEDSLQWTTASAKWSVKFEQFLVRANFLADFLFCVISGTVPHQH